VARDAALTASRWNCSPAKLEPFTGYSTRAAHWGKSLPAKFPGMRRIGECGAAEFSGSATRPLAKYSNIMKARILFGALAFGFTLALAAGEPGFKPIFNGKDLTGWEGRTNHWSVQDGAITGVTTKENPAKGNNFLIWRPYGTNEVIEDFELRLSYKIVPNNDKGFGNSGIQYRSKAFDNFVVRGYQADFEAGKTHSGILYEEGMDGILAQRGQKTVVKTVNGKTKVEVTGSVGDSKQIQAAIHDKDWNEYVVIAKGNHLQHFINGVPTVDVTDERENGKDARSGILAFQIHAGEPMTVQFKNIRLQRLGKDSASAHVLKTGTGALLVTYKSE
jgi:hypothetical protein